MNDAYYSPDDDAGRVRSDIRSLVGGDAPAWWDEAFHDFVQRGAATRSWFDLAQGYEFAAQHLIERLRTLGLGVRIQLTPPIVFLYRHAVELMVKQTFATLEALDGRDPEIPGTHNFMPLWRSVRERLVEGLVDPGSELRVLDEALAAVEALDPNSYTFRYPMDRRGVSTPNMPPIDPAALGRVVTHVIDVLTVAVSRLEELRAGRDWRAPD